MKKRVLLCSVAVALSLAAVAQKKPLDHSVYDGWKSIASPTINADGSVVTYEVTPQEGDGALHLYQPKAKKAQEIIIERGYSASVTPDGKYAVALIKPQFALTRQAKIDKKKGDEMPKDSLAIVSFADGSIVKFANVESFKLGEDASPYFAFLSADTTLVTTPTKGEKDAPKSLIVYSFDKGVCDTIERVSNYAFDKNGKSLALVTSPKKGESLVAVYTPATSELKQISEESMAYYSLPTFDPQGSKMLYLASTDSLSSGSKQCDLYLYNIGESSAKQLIKRGYSKNIPATWALCENSKPRFSENSERIFVGIAPIIAPKDTTLVSFETAGLDLWHYSTPEIPPMELANLKEDLKRTCTTIYDSSRGELIPLSTSLEEKITLVNKGDAPFAIAFDKTPYLLQTQWDTQNPADIYLVDLASGARTEVAKGVITSEVTASPEYKYLLWYNTAERVWYTYNIESATTATLMADAEVTLWNEIHDTPSYPDAYGFAGWSKGDNDVFIYDNFDVWKVASNGSSAINITAGEGRKSNRTFRYINTDPSLPPVSPYRRGSVGEPKAFEPKEEVLLSVFDNTTKKNGYALTTFDKAVAPSIKVLDGYSFGMLKKSEESDSYIYTKANFETSPNVYITESKWKNESRLSNINPQQDDYLWGTVELCSWNAYDGTPLEGLIYKPENFDEAKKYPVLIYFYERSSETMYNYCAPTPSRSIINISFFVSRGYVVFVPDIVYSTGIPGESAYNCIVSGAEALAKNEWVDADNMALQGQSWGGYQTAYLVTRTNMFKAAGAGAPVSNMTSAYGGIRWTSGMSRQFQYEHTQSRIGQTLFEAPELYIANSPVFKAERVETPLLIMHNDNDGAVPWYQGIEYFMALRRLGKTVWMLQYNGEEHNLTQRRNSKDLAVRLQQFFDHYLKGDPMPAWMKSGIPASRKGEYFGFELE